MVGTIKILSHFVSKCNDYVNNNCVNVVLKLIFYNVWDIGVNLGIF